MIWERLCWLHFKRERTSFLAGSWLEVYKEHYIIRVSAHATRLLPDARTFDRPMLT